MATAKDSVLVSNNIYNRLFAGIELPSTQRVRALEIIRKAFVAMVAVHAPEREQWARTRVLTDRRDSALKSLIGTPGDKRKFDQHAADFRSTWPDWARE
jgi:hypothetical protein